MFYDNIIIMVCLLYTVIARRLKDLRRFISMCINVYDNIIFFICPPNTIISRKLKDLERFIVDRDNC